MTAYDLVHAHYAASSAGDLEGMTKDFAADIVWTEAAGSAFPGRFVGLASIVEGVFGPLQAAIADFQVHTDELHAAADDPGVVIMIGRYSGTFRATGKPFETRVVHRWAASGDRLTAMEQIVDSHLMWLAQQP